MACYVFIATSLDGFIATSDGGVRWLDAYTDPDNDYGYEAFIAGIDAVVMGRKTFETALSFDAWPYAKPVFVVSTTLHAVPDRLEGQVEIINDTPLRIVETLANRGLPNLYIDGGVTIRHFLNADLIDGMFLSRVPLLLGEGVPLFDGSGREMQFAHVGTESFASGIVKSHYRRIREI